MSNIGLATDLVLANTSVRPGTLVLPLSTQIPGRTITVKCATGSCAVSTCYISTSGGDTFEDGSTTQALITNYGFMKMTANATQKKWYLGATTQPTSYAATTIQAITTQATTISSATMNVSTLSLGSTNTLYVTSTSLGYWGPYLLNSGFRTAVPQFFFPTAINMFISSGLVNRWRFSEGTGTTFADSVGGQNGTLYNSPAWSTGPLTYASSIVWNATNSTYGTSTAGGIQCTTMSGTNWTLTVWIYVPSYGVYVYLCTGGNEFLTFVYTNGKIYIGSNAGFVSTEIISSASIPTNTWTNVTYVKTGTSLQIFINGVGDTIGTVTPVGVNGSLNFGRNTAYGYYCSLKMADVRLYNRALSPAEVSQIYNGTG